MTFLESAKVSISFDKQLSRLQHKSAIKNPLMTDEKKKQIRVNYVDYLPNWIKKG